MSENFNLEIISPDQTLFNSEVKQVSIPAYEGIMTILKDHITLITFLRPGFIEIDTNKKIDQFYIEDGTVEFSNNKLLILSPSVIQVEKLAKINVEKMIEESKELLQNSDIKDNEKHILSYKIDTLQKIN
jgi:F-type H+-transporting ATPase subunit epsilon|tara:strand:- start:867 stop:1256 length:390 start_codon:yes stop_codon:yes gene_type:complete